MEEKIKSNKKLLKYIRDNMVAEKEKNPSLPPTPKKWKVGDKCRVNTKIKGLPDECEAEVEEMLPDSSVSVSLHGYGREIRVKTSQLGPSKGERAREEQTSAAIAYTISRMEEKTPKERYSDDVRISLRFLVLLTYVVPDNGWMKGG